MPDWSLLAEIRVEWRTGQHTLTEDTETQRGDCLLQGPPLAGPLSAPSQNYVFLLDSLTPLTPDTKQKQLLSRALQ